MKIRFESFFRYYITHPWDQTLPTREKVMAVALSLLVFVSTMGIAHAISKFFEKRRIHQVKKESFPGGYTSTSETQKKFYNGVLKADEVYDRVIKAAPPTDLSNIHRSRVGTLSQRNLSKRIQRDLIGPFYAKELPKHEDVKVPHPDRNGEWVYWRELTKEQKVRLNNMHSTHAGTKMTLKQPEALVNFRFFGPPRAAFLPNDPRAGHGCDHAVRASLWASVFAYLYAKYDPDHTVDEEQVLLAQFAAAAHDAGRETEGTDVYDDKSAMIAVETLKKYGVTDEATLQTVFDAIAHKDSKELSRKSLIAKCVHDADSAEFSRLLLGSEFRHKEGFEDSLRYLDIFNELSQRESLKDGRSADEFRKELEYLLIEINKIIYQTHQKKYRKECAESPNYYDAMRTDITPGRYPFLYHALIQAGVATDPEKARKQEMVRQALGRIRAYVDRGVDQLGTGQIDQLIEEIKALVPQTRQDKFAISHLKQTLEREQTERRESEKKYLEFLAESSVNISSLIDAYAELPTSIRFKHYPSCIQALGTTNIEGRSENSFELLRLDIRHNELKKLLDSGSDLKTLSIQTDALIDAYHRCVHPHKDPGVQTTVALAYRSLFDDAMANKDHDAAREILRLAGSKIQIDPQSPLNRIDLLLNPRHRIANDVEWLNLDCGFLRKRKMRIAERQSEIDKFFEFSFEVPSSHRKQLESCLELWKEDPNVKISFDESVYYAIGPDGKPNTGKKQKLGSGKREKKIELYKEGRLLATFSIGNNPKYWNQYHLMRVHVPKTTSTQELHEAFAKVGLPMGLLPSRKEDLEHEAQRRSMAFRFPHAVYDDNGYKRPFKEAWNLLTEAQKEQVKEDTQRMQMVARSDGTVEYVLPDLGKEAWDKGVRSVGTFINAYDMKQTAAVLQSIFRSGNLSAQERYLRGIVGTGCVPMVNYKCGSGNQVFCRYFTENLFDQEYWMKNFPVSGPVLILFDVQVIERMPYAYTNDRGGVRNPEYRKGVFPAQKQTPIVNFQGDKYMRKRPSFDEFVGKIRKTPHPLNEVMFDHTISPEYMRRIVVWKPEDRLNLIHHLHTKGVFHINGIPLEEFIVVSDRLTPEMVH